MSDDMLVIGAGPKAQRLCQVCAKLDLTAKRDIGARIPHQPDYRSLDLSARRGCSLCQLLQYGLLHEAHISPAEAAFWHWQIDTTGLSTGFFLPRPSAQEDHIIFGRHIDMATEDGEQTLLGNTRVSFRDLLLAGWRSYVPFHLARGPGFQLVAPFPNMQLCQRWLSECLGPYHCSCPGMSLVPLPTRVLSVGLVGSLSISLINASGRNGVYATLSHCWGTGTTVIKTLRTNIQDHMAGIQVDSLPATFRDAVKVARQLGFEYLWIDSLCIVQDDELDWQQESSAMQRVYRQSSLTIAAASAPDAASGFLHFREDKGPSPCCISRSGENDHILAYPGMVERRKRTRNYLDTRAWAFQERLLSRRVLTFCDNVMYFSCHKGVAFESWPENFQTLYEPHWIYKHSEIQAPGDSATLAKDWAATVESFTHMDLTYQKDVLSAISGLARQLCELVKAQIGCVQLGQYAAGIWLSQSYVAQFLSWQARRGEAKKQYAHPDQPNVPSWSWVSCDRPVNFPHTPLDVWKYCIELVTYDAKPRDIDEYGDLEPGATLRLRAKLLPCTLRDPKPNELPEALEFIYDERDIICDVRNAEAPGILEHNFLCRPDNIGWWDRAKSDAESSFSLLPLLYSSSSMYALLVVRNTTGRYRRVGLCTKIIMVERKIQEENWEFFQSKTLSDEVDWQEIVLE